MSHPMGWDEQDRAFVGSAAIFGRRVHANAVDKGFWDDARSDGECIALIHSEASELLEGLRHGNPPSDHISEFTAAEEELADLVIRAFDFAEARGHRLPAALVAKHKFNEGRA